MTFTVRNLLLTGSVLLGGFSSAYATTMGGNAYFFGDSLTDCCTLGRTTNGLNWADLLPAQIGASYSATTQSNYAVGGAQSGGVLQSDFLSQVARFTASATTVRANDVAGLWIGTNDVWQSAFAVTDSYAGYPVVGPIGIQPSISSLTSYIMGNIQSGIEQLKADGFQNFVLLSTYDLGQAGIQPNAAAATLTSQYSTALNDAEAALSIQGATIYWVDVESLLQRVQADPAAYGFQHITGQDNCAASNCLTQPLSIQNTYVFQDGIHLTTAFDRVIADEAAAIVNARQTPIPEPASASLLLAVLAAAGVARGTRQSPDLAPAA